MQALRRIYGPGFFLIGVVASEDERRQYLRDRKGCSEDEIQRLLTRDEHEEGDDLGQRTRDTFHLADVFIPLEDTASLKRFLALVFGHPYETPTRDEYAMFLAFSAALRSADLSRQVGAVVVSGAGDVVAIGTNDVPLAGGGLCWPGETDYRDHFLGYDPNAAQRREIVNEILEKLRPDDTDKAAWEKIGWAKLKVRA